MDVLFIRQLDAIKALPIQSAIVSKLTAKISAVFDENSFSSVPLRPRIDSSSSLIVVNVNGVIF